MSTSTIFPPLIVKPMTENGRPRGATTTPAAPFTSAGRTNGESREKVSVCSATARAPRTSLDRPARTAPPSIRSTTSGSSTASSASKSPSREAAKKASTTSRWRGEVGVGNVRFALDPAAGAARQLPCRGRRAPHDGSDLLKRHREHVVQHERESLGGSERFEYHQQRQTDRVG